MRNPRILVEANIKRLVSISSWKREERQGHGQPIMSNREVGLQLSTVITLLQEE
jgi:hypothetical protein